MKKLVCTQSYVGFLCAVYAFFKGSHNAEAIENELLSRNFLDEYIVIDEDIKIAKAVRNGLRKKGGAVFYNEVADAYLSGNPKKESIILDYLKLFIKYGKDALSMYDRAEVVAFKDILSKVTNEAQRVSAFVRLMETTTGVYYGYFSSDNDVLEKVMFDLIPRLNTIAFVVHDYKRKKAAVYDGNKCEYIVVENGVTIELSDSEKVFQSLWTQYHKNVSIAARENPRLQRQFAPKKYRHFMHEF